MLSAVLLISSVAISSSPALSAGFSEQQQLVDKARLTLEVFAADPGD